MYASRRARRVPWRVDPKWTPPMTFDLPVLLLSSAHSAATTNRHTLLLQMAPYGIWTNGPLTRRTWYRLPA